MFNLIRKDFLVTFANKFAFYLLLGMVPLLMLFMDNFDSNMIFMYSVLTFVFICTRTPFAYEIKDKPHLLIQSLPVTKTDIVISKYLSFFIYFTIGAVFTLVYLLFLTLLGFINISNLMLETVIITLATSILLLSISLPAEFMFSPKTSNLVNIIVYVIFLNFFIIGDSPLLQFINLFSDFRIGIALIIFVVYFLSIGISVLLYRNRKFY